MISYPHSVSDKVFNVLSRGFQTNISGAVWSNMHYLTILTVFVIALRGNYSSPDQMVGKILPPFAPRSLTHYKFIVATPIINISNEACTVDEPLVSRKVSTYSSSCIEICRMFIQLSASNLYSSSCFLERKIAFWKARLISQLKKNQRSPFLFSLQITRTSFDDFGTCERKALCMIWPYDVTYWLLWGETDQNS